MDDINRTNGRELRVLIVGGGIAGLTLAALMRQRGMEAETAEQTESYGGVGYVLVLWPAGSDILKGVGLYEAFTAAAMRERVRDSRWQREHPAYVESGERGRTVRRLVFGDVPLRYLGLTGWAFWLPSEMVPAGMAREYWGAGHFVGLYPAPGVLCSFVAAPASAATPDPVDRRIARLRATLQAWEETGPGDPGARRRPEADLA